MTDGKDGKLKAADIARIFGVTRQSVATWPDVSLELLAASRKPETLGKATRARHDRAKQRDLDRANAAQVLLKAETAKRPQRNYSMAQAALARIAAGAEPCELPPDKRRRKRKG